MTSDTRSAMMSFVDRLHRRSPLSGEESDALLALSGYTSVARANVDIVSLGQDTQHACLVLDGLAGRFGQIVDGQRQITALHIAGDMCDLHSVVAPKAGWALQALAPTAILRVPHAQLMAVARAYPNVAEAFWRDCSVDASVLSQWVVNIGRRSARSRMAHLLCEMAVRMDDAGFGTRHCFKLQASQMQIGDMLGLTAVHVNRTIKLLREIELVTIRSHEITILNWAGLTRLGDFDEQYLQIGSLQSACRAH